MRPPWKIPYDFSDSTRPAFGAVEPPTLPKRIHIRRKAAFLRPVLPVVRRARGRIHS